MAIEDTIINGIFMIVIFFVGSWIYTKFIMKYVIRDEIKSMIRDLSEAIRNDGETKERIKEIIDAIIDEATIKIKEAWAKHLGGYDIPEAIRRLVSDKR